MFKQLLILKETSLLDIVADNYLLKTKRFCVIFSRVFVGICMCNFAPDFEPGCLSEQLSTLDCIY